MPLSDKSRALAQEWVQRLRANLWGSVLPFWMTYSIDKEHGGYFNNLGEDGAVFDTTKHVWLQGRQAWMLARIANMYTEAEIAALVAAHPAPPATAFAGGPATACALTRPSLIACARAGVDFLRAHAVDASDGSVYFALTREGAPALAQRKPFSAFFLVMALAEVARATGDGAYRAEAEALLDRVERWDAAPGGCGAALGKPGLPGAAALAPLNMPMIFLNVRAELVAAARLDARAAAAYRAPLRARCIEGVLAHVDAAARRVYEAVGPRGPDHATPAGRLLNPGHAIEAGWFLLDEARAGADEALARRALECIDIAFEAGWDGPLGDGRAGAPAREQPPAPGAGTGGFIYFRDAAGLPPTPLEKDMKLWWPQAEAMVAFAKAAAHSRSDAHVDAFDRVARWTWEHLVTDREWFGYADRTGAVTHRFKGGPYKGCFHVPRALLYAELALAEALQEEGTAAAPHQQA
jgi:N-acylglucosamine 2-epimerase